MLGGFMSNRYRQTWATINLDNLWQNFQTYENLNPDKFIIPVIKANAYGHGVTHILNYLYEKGLRFYAVSLLEEALELRNLYQDIDILIMGAILKEHLEVCSKNNLIFTIYDEDIYHSVIESELKLKCHFKVDSGMHRYGISNEDLSIKMIEKLQERKNIQLEGVYTHFATASDNESYYYEQLKMFDSVINQLKLKPQIIHVSNSSSSAKYEKQITYTTHVRLGIGLYGLTLDQQNLPLKPVLSLYTKIIQIKHLKDQECLGYGITYCAKEDETIALLPIGYADGFIRKNKFGNVEINQSIYPIVGNICMDTTFVKVDSHIKKGDVVTLIGTMVTTDEVASRLKTINYEVVTNLSNRVPRIYIKDGKIDD
jgi:alanine racemase